MKYNRVDPLFIKTTNDFIAKLQAVSQEVGLAILFGKIKNKASIEDKVVKRLTPIFYRYFDKSISASNKIVKQEVADIVKDYSVPMKYNKDLIKKINDSELPEGSVLKGGTNLFAMKFDEDPVFKVIQIGDTKYIASLEGKFFGTDAKIFSMLNT